LGSGWNTTQLSYVGVPEDLIRRKWFVHKYIFLFFLSLRSKPPKTQNFPMAGGWNKFQNECFFFLLLFPFLFLSGKKNSLVSFHLFIIIIIFLPLPLLPPLLLLPLPVFQWNAVEWLQENEGVMGGVTQGQIGGRCAVP
jgi:hypothetical protein